MSDEATRSSPARSAAGDAFLSVIRGARRIRDARNRRAESTRGRCTLEEGFALWAEYIASAYEHSKLTSSAVMHLRIEDLLANPDLHLTSLARHAGLRPKPETIAASARTIDRRDRFAFLEDSAAKKLYRSVRGTPWMRRLGYHDLLER